MFLFQPQFHYIFGAVFNLDILRCFWLCSGTVSKRVYFLSRRDKTFSSLMDVLLKSLPLLLPQKHHLVLAANVATLGLMMARILAGSAGKGSSHWQSPHCAVWAETRNWEVGLEKANRRETGPVCHWKSDKLKICRSKEYAEHSAG